VVVSAGGQGPYLAYYFPASDGSGAIYEPLDLQADGKKRKLGEFKILGVVVGTQFKLRYIEILRCRG
jgi:hypothetical protein